VSSPVRTANATSRTAALNCSWSTVSRLQSEVDQVPMDVGADGDDVAGHPAVLDHHFVQNGRGDVRERRLAVAVPEVDERGVSGKR